jgi:hypothetical protein
MAELVEADAHWSDDLAGLAELHGTLEPSELELERLEAEADLQRRLATVMEQIRKREDEVGVGLVEPNLPSLDMGPDVSDAFANQDRRQRLEDAAACVDINMAAYEAILRQATPAELVKERTSSQILLDERRANRRLATGEEAREKRQALLPTALATARERLSRLREQPQEDPIQGPELRLQAAVQVSRLMAHGVYQIGEV